MADKGNYGIEITFEAETVKFDGAIKSMDKAIKALRKDITAINQNLKFDNLNTDLLKRKYQDYQQIIKATEQKLKQYRTELSKVYDENHNVIKGKEDEWVRLRGAISETQGELVKLNDLANKLKTTIDNIKAYKMSEGFETAGKHLNTASKYAENLARALAPLSVVATAGLGGAAKAAIEFESAMAGVKKTVEETPTTSYEQLEKTFRAMAQDVPASAAEIAAVAEMAGQLGIQADSIENFTKVMIDLGNATNLTATDGAKAVAQFFNIMGHTSEEVNELVDNFGAAVTALGNNSATTEEDIVYMAKALAAASHTVGLTDQEVLGLATSLASLGLSAERGGSAMSTVMRKIHTDVNMVTDAGEERLAAWGELMGMTAEEFRKAWNEDSVRVLHDIVLGLNQTEDAGKSLYEVLSDVDVSNIRQIDTISRLALGYDRFDEYMAMANDEWEKNTALTIEANRRYATTESQLKILKNRLTDVGITLGETILPIINDLVSKAKPLLDRLNDFVSRNGKLVTTLLATGAALSPVLFGFSKILKVGGTLATAVGKYIKLGVEATTTLGKIGAAIGVGLSGAGLIAGVVALTAGVGALGYAWIKAKDDAYQFSKEIEGLQSAMDKTIEKADEEYRSRVLQAEGALYYAQNLDNLIDSLDKENQSEEQYASTKEKIKQYVDLLNGALGEAKYYFDEETGKVMENGQAVDNVTESYRKLLDEMRKTAWIQSHQEAFNEAVENEQKGYEMASQAVDEYSNRISDLEQKYKLLTIPEDVRQSLIEYTQGMGGSLDEIKMKLAEIPGFLDIFRGDYSEMSEWIDTFVLNAEGAYDAYNGKIEEANGLISESKAVQEQYNQVLNGTAEDFMAIQAQIAATNDLTQLSNEKLIEQRNLFAGLQLDYVQRYGEQNAYYAEMIRMIDEQMAKNTAAAEEEQRLQGETKDSGITNEDELQGYREQRQGEAEDAMEAKSDATADAAEAYAKSKADSIKSYVDSMTFSDKYIDIYARVHGLEQLSSLGGSGGYQYQRAGQYRSGGYNSGNYNVTINSNVNVSGGNVSALQAKVFAEQIVETVNNELGKRLRYA